MWDRILVGVILTLAAVVLGVRAWRKLSGRDGCGCCCPPGSTGQPKPTGCGCGTGCCQDAKKPPGEGHG